MSQPEKPSAIDAPIGRIAKDALVLQSGVPSDEIDRYVALGLISGPNAVATYDAGNITRLRLIKTLQQAGISVEKLAAAVSEKRLSLDFAGRIIAEPVSVTDMTIARACEQLGVIGDTFVSLMLALGVETPSESENIREDDLEFLHMFAAARELGLPEAAILSALRSFAISMRRLADASRELMPAQVEKPMLAGGVPFEEMFERRTKISVALQRMSYRASFLLHRRHYEHDIYENITTLFRRALEDSPEKTSRDIVEEAICFIDLSGFTQRTENLGDTDAASVGATLVDIANTESTRHMGFLIKPLGDGAMLRFERAEDAVLCAQRIVAVARQTGLPPVRAGIALGPLTLHDGDYYGRTVNRAARMLGVAEPGQVLVTGETARAAARAGLRFTEIGVVKLKGVSEPVYACAANAA
jgi:adenylate cyclase